MNKFKENKIFELVKLLLATIPKVDFSIVGTANKQDDSVVTNVDYEVNSIVISKIKYLFGKEVPIISEEIENDKDYINSCYIVICVLLLILLMVQWRYVLD